MGKKQKIKKTKSIKLLKDKKNKNLISILISLFLTVGVVFAATGVELLISPQSSTSLGSNNSTISFSTGSQTTHYVNDGNNSTIIGNYLKGYYYDDVFGFFKLDWSTNKDENVHIVGTTSACGTGVGYKLGGKAQGIYGIGVFNEESAGYIDFDYDSSTFVYYCENDKRLHGKGYSRWIGYQDFEGIGFEILVDGTSVTTFTGAIDLFLNDDTNVDTIEVFTGSNSNVSLDKILGEEFNLNSEKGSIFYIIK